MKNKHLYTASATLLVLAFFSAVGFTEEDPHLLSVEQKADFLLNDWELYMVDFTRAFRLYNNLRNPDNLIRCSRELLGKLRALDSETLSAKAWDYLNDLEIEGVIKRRDKIVSHFEELTAEKGESAVLY